jgi:hypothetical protein
MAFTWLTERWELPQKWFAEGLDGELFRTGDGIHSTEHLMAQVMIRAAGGHNRAFPFSNPGAASKAASAIINTLNDLNAFVLTDEFVALLDHLNQNGHFRNNSPRFDSLRDFLYK